MTLKPGPVQLRDFQYESERQGFEASRNQLCWYCLKRLATESDHFYPWARGVEAKRGTHKFAAQAAKLGGDNLIPSCKTCNCIKGARLISEWVRRLVIQNLPVALPPFFHHDRKTDREEREATERRGKPFFTLQCPDWDDESNVRQGEKPVG